MQQPPELLKSFANRLAQLAVSEDGHEALRLLRLTGLFGDVSGKNSVKSSMDDIGHQPKVSSVGRADITRVGIWEKKQENGQTYFVRSKDKLEDWNYWANLGRIEAKGTRKRVLLIGESVARGYLYDPQFTCAMALEKVLHSQMGQDAVEVIDLARTNLGFEVQDLAIAALELEPDAVVIFSGNNWRCVFPPSADFIPRIDVTLREQGVGATKHQAEESLAGEVKRVVQKVCAAYKSRGIPLVWIVPEFNLGDWRDPLTNAPHLAEGDNLEWINNWDAAQVALQAGDYETASALASKMVELDQQVNVAGLYILAECSEKLGDVEAARNYLELARDSVIWDSSKSAAPRTFSVAQQILRDEATKHNCHVLDMPKIFKEYLKGGLPGRRMFLDYCHMTAEGIQVTMAAAASSVLKSFNKPDMPWTALLNQAASPSAQVEAEAAFLAAVHSAHWWQPYDVVLYFCSKALQHSRHIAQIMRCFIDMQTRRAPMLMCRAAEEISGSGSPLIQHYLLRYNNQQMDEVLLSAVIAALKEVGIDAQADLDRLRREEFSVARYNIDLLDYYHSSASLQPQEVLWVLPKRDGFLPSERHHYYKAYWRESKFVFVGEAQNSVHLQLTCRLRYPSASAPNISLRVNAVKAGVIEIGQGWSVWNVTIPGRLIKDGLNEIAIDWPMPEFPGREGLGDVLSDLLDKNKLEFFCIFGEIYSFTACDGSKAVKTSTVTHDELSAIGVD